MIALNGGLTGVYGVWLAAVIIHVTGLFFVLAWLAAKRENPFRHPRLPLYLYGAGVIGFFTTLFNNMAFGTISVSAILALCLLGQSLFSICIDHFGLFGMQKTPFKAKKIIGLLFIALGIAFMIFVQPMGLAHGKTAIFVAALVSFLTGITIVASRTVNARLAVKTSMLTGTFYNYVTGLCVALLAFPIMSGGFGGFAALATPLRWQNAWIFFGGLAGVTVVMLQNVVVAKLPAFSVSLLMFVGQIFAGILIDIIIARSFSLPNLIGGLFVTVGLAINMFVERGQGSGRQGDTAKSNGRP